MSDSNPQTYQRRSRRIWLDPKGQPVKATIEVVSEPEPKQALVTWSASIFDTGSGEEVVDYPRLEGEATVRADTPDQSRADIASVYVAKIGMLDGNTVTQEAIDKLKQNLSVGIWEVVPFIKTPEVAA